MRNFSDYDKPLHHLPLFACVCVHSCMRACIRACMHTCVCACMRHDHTQARALSCTIAQKFAFIYILYKWFFGGAGLES
jgi:hypothetical protein